MIMIIYWIIVLWQPITGWISTAQTYIQYNIAIRCRTLSCLLSLPRDKTDCEYFQRRLRRERLSLKTADRQIELLLTQLIRLLMNVACVYCHHCDMTHAVARQCSRLSHWNKEMRTYSDSMPTLRAHVNVVRLTDSRIIMIIITNFCQARGLKHYYIIIIVQVLRNLAADQLTMLPKG